MHDIHSDSVNTFQLTGPTFRYDIADSWWCNWDDLTEACHLEANTIRTEFLLSGEHSSVFLTSHLDSDRVQQIIDRLQAFLAAGTSDGSGTLGVLTETLQSACVQDLFERGMLTRCTTSNSLQLCFANIFLSV